MLQAENTERVFRTYRLTLSGLLTGIALFDVEGGILLGIDRDMFLVTSFSWFLFSLVTSLSQKRPFGNKVGLTLNLVIDVLVLSALGWMSGGIESGLPYLMLPSAAIAGLILRTQPSLFIAAVATFGILLTQALLIRHGQPDISSLLPAGILGAMLFACAVSFSSLEKRISLSEKKAKLSAEEAADYQLLSEEIITHMLTGVVVVNEDSVISMINPSAEKMLAATNSVTSTLVGSNLRRFEGLQRSYTRWQNNNSDYVPSFTHRYSGVDIQPHFRAITLGESDNTLITLEDTRYLRQQAQQAKVFALGKLSASLAHEVRNPLSAINQANDLLSVSPNIHDEDRKLVDVISRHCERMDKTITVSYQLSRQLEPHQEHIALNSWLEEFVDEYKESQEAPCQIHLKVPEDAHINFDPQHLTQVLRNLVDNGVKYSESFCGKRDVAILSSSDRTKRLTFVDVHDRGPGIPKDEIEDAFSAFQSKAGSAGMGLYLCRELCEANFASINYLYKSDQQESGFFRITAWIQQPDQ